MNVQGNCQYCGQRYTAENRDCQFCGGPLPVVEERPPYRLYGSGAASFSATSAFTMVVIGGETHEVRAI